MAEIPQWKIDQLADVVAAECWKATEDPEFMKGFDEWKKQKCTGPAETDQCRK